MINSDFNKKVTVVIRSAGERTVDLCRSLILAQGISFENIVTIQEAPFSAALRKGFEIGITHGHPWTLCVDADVLLRPGAIAQMIEFAEQQEENVCEVQGKIIDKFFGGSRDGGIHLYRTSLLPVALACIPEEGVNIRPEFHTLHTMRGKGYPWIIVPYIVGLHDFEQYNKDIFRKCFVQAHKHAYLAELFLSIWRESAAVDTDFQVALKGFAAGIAHFGGVFIDTRQKNYQESFAGCGIEEKPDLSAGSYSPDNIEKIIANWSEHAVYRKYFKPTQAPFLKKWGFFSLIEKLRELFRTLGPLRMMPYILGVILYHSGEKIKNWVKP